LYPLLGLLFDGVEFHPNVIGIHVAILLQDQGSQFNLVGWCWLQSLELIPSPASQIKLGNFEKFVRIEVAHLSRHTEPLRPVANVLVIASPE
jgi:hypothetical protein